MELNFFALAMPLKVCGFRVNQLLPPKKLMPLVMTISYMVCEALSVTRTSVQNAARIYKLQLLSIQFTLRCLKCMISGMSACRYQTTLITSPMTFSCECNWQACFVVVFIGTHHRPQSSPSLSVMMSPQLTVGC